MATVVCEHAAMLCYTYRACLIGNVLVRTAAVRSVVVASQCFKAICLHAVKRKIRIFYCTHSHGYADDWQD